jgi:hypothetical protein
VIIIDIFGDTTILYFSIEIVIPLVSLSIISKFVNFVILLFVLPKGFTLLNFPSRPLCNALSLVSLVFVPKLTTFTPFSGSFKYSSCYLFSIFINIPVIY